MNEDEWRRYWLLSWSEQTSWENIQVPAEEIPIGGGSAGEREEGREVKTVKVKQYNQKNH